MQAKTAATTQVKKTPGPSSAGNALKVQIKALKVAVSKQPEAKRNALSGRFRVK